MAPPSSQKNVRHARECNTRALTMGTFDFLIIWISSDMPPRSPAPIPSTSSMMMHLFRIGALFPLDSPVSSKVNAREPATSPRRPRQGLLPARVRGVELEDVPARLPGNQGGGGGFPPKE